MAKRQGLQAGSGSFGNAMRGWLYFGEDAPVRPVTSRAKRLRHPQRPGTTVQRQQPFGLPVSVPSAGGTRYELGHEFEHELEQVISQRVAERTRALEETIKTLHQRQHQLEVQAHYDTLTGLANRKLLQDRFQTAVERAKRSGDSFALLMIDLDGFKAVNDSFGHLAGDGVLVTVAQRLLACSRNCDTAARIGGDEFVLIVESIHDAAEVTSIGHKLIRALSQDIEVDDDTTVTIGASLGIAMYPDDGAGLSEMMSVADLAMYECKSSGHMSL